MVVDDDLRNLDQDDDLSFPNQIPKRPLQRLGGLPIGEFSSRKIVDKVLAKNTNGGADGHGAYPGGVNWPFNS